MANRKYRSINYTRRLRALNKSIAKNHLVRRLYDYIQSLDLSPLEKYLSKSKRGPKPIPLWIPVLVWVYAYFKGVQSYRSVSELCSTDDNFYWASRAFEPSPAYLESWKLRIFPLFPGILKDLQKHLLEIGFLESDLYSLDGTKVSSWASPKQSKTQNQITKEIEKLS
jgi:transposase